MDFWVGGFLGQKKGLWAGMSAALAALPGVQLPGKPSRDVPVPGRGFGGKTPQWVTPKLPQSQWNSGSRGTREPVEPCRGAGCPEHQDKPRRGGSGVGTALDQRGSLGALQEPLDGFGMEFGEQMQQ